MELIIKTFILKGIKTIQLCLNIFIACVFFVAILKVFTSVSAFTFIAKEIRSGPSISFESSIPGENGLSYALRFASVC